MAIKPLKLISEVIQFVLIIALVVVAIASFGTRVPLLAQRGLNFFSVTSGSMEPTIPAGSLLQVGRYRLEDLKEGDIITYRVINPENNQQAIVTHRIFKVVKEEEQQDDKKTVTYTFTTKGDANTAEDNYTLKPGDIIGLYKWHLPKIGYLSSFAQTPTGFVSMVVVPAAILIIWEIITLVMYFRRQFQQKAEAELAVLRAELAEAKAAPALVPARSTTRPRKKTKRKEKKKNDS